MIYLTGGILTGVKEAARVISTPFVWTVGVVAHPIGHVLAGVINYSDVVHQNEQLRTALGAANLRASENALAAQEYLQLTRALHLPDVSTLPVVSAPVSTVSPTNFVTTFTIGKGASSGVQLGMPVVANGGLVGRVTSVSLHQAVVMEISDATSLVGATFGAGTTSVLVQGSGGGNTLSASAIPITAPLQVGALLRTTGQAGGLFPAGLPVATVTKIVITPGASTYSVSLSPAADLADLSTVDVILWEPGT